MKKSVILMFVLMLAALVMISCGSSEGTSTKDNETTENSSVDESASAETPETVLETQSDESKEPEYTAFPKKEIPNEKNYEHYYVFKAPEGNPRDIVMDYMLKMAKVEWTPTTTWTTGWKNTAEFKVNLTYEAGKTYYGVPYSDSRSTLGEFALFLDNGTFTPNSPYYEELIGNHCSSSMCMAFQQVIDLSYPAGLRPTTKRIGLLKFPDGIITPPGENESSPNLWYSDQVIKINDRDTIFEGYASLDKGDIVMKDMKSGGHTRMVSKVEVSRTIAGKINAGRSYVYCVEQTNAWYDKNENSTWWIDKKYSFTQLYESNFMPVTLCIYHEENPVIDDAVICMEGTNTPESVVKMLNGTIESNFPLTYVYVTVTDDNGEIIKEHLEYRMGELYKYNLRKLSYNLAIDKLESGTYKFELKAGIARGDVTLESFDFTIA